MGWSDIPTVLSLLMATLIPLHLVGLSGSWLYGGIQFVGLAALIIVGMRCVRTRKRRALFFGLGYPLVVFVTNVWILLDEVFR